MGEVLQFNGITRLDTDPDRMLNAAIGNMEHVVILGFHKDGSEYFAASQADGAQVLWHLERAKHKLMRIVDDMTEAG